MMNKIREETLKLRQQNNDTIRGVLGPKLARPLEEIWRRQEEHGGCLEEKHREEGKPGREETVTRPLVEIENRGPQARISGKQADGNYALFLDSFKRMAREAGLNVKICEDQTEGARGTTPRIGPKVHITIPAIEEGLFHKAAVHVSERLFSLARNSDNFHIKVFNERIEAGDSQFGKDFTVYFGSEQDYKEALGTLKEISGFLVDFGGDSFIFFGGIDDGANRNVRKERKASAYVRISIRNHYGYSMAVRNNHPAIAEFLLGKTGAEKEFAEQVISNPSMNANGLVIFTDDYVRHNNSAELMAFLDHLYQKGALGEYR